MLVSYCQSQESQYEVAPTLVGKVEARGESTIKSCIEMAWMMGFIAF
jgi:3-oxoacyl-ACP reductase-like protein